MTITKYLIYFNVFSIIGELWIFESSIKYSFQKDKVSNLISFLYLEMYERYNERIKVGSFS